MTHFFSCDVLSNFKSKKKKKKNHSAKTSDNISRKSPLSIGRTRSVSQLLFIKCNYLQMKEIK